MLEVEHTIRILKETLQSIEKNDTVTLKLLSNQTIHSASINQDPDNIGIAVSLYSLSKIFERQSYRAEEGWENTKRIIINSIKNSIKDLEVNNLEKFRRDFSFIQRAINKISGKLKKYIEDVFIKAKINKASRIHEHGISLEKTAKLLGLTVFDLAEYTGRTGISEAPLNKTVEVKERVKMMEDIFQ